MNAAQIHERGAAGGSTAAAAAAASAAAAKARLPPKSTPEREATQNTPAA